MTLTSILSIRERFANLFLRVRHREFKIPSTISGHTALGAETRRRKKSVRQPHSSNPGGTVLI